MNRETGNNIRFPFPGSRFKNFFRFSLNDYGILENTLFGIFPPTYTALHPSVSPLRPIFESGAG